MKQNSKTQSATITPGEPAYEESKPATTVSDIANEIIADGEAEGLNTNALKAKKVAQPIQSQVQITEEKNLNNYKKAMSNTSVEVNKNVEDGAGEDNVLSTNERIMQNILTRDEIK